MTAHEIVEQCPRTDAVATESGRWSAGIDVDVLADDEVLAALLDDALDLRADLVPRFDRIAAVVRPEVAVLVEREHELLGAVDLGALAHEGDRICRAAEQ